MRLLKLLCFVLFSLQICFSQDFHGDKYQKQIADDKSNELWNATIRDKTSNSWPNELELAELFLESMNVTFDTVADDMPTQFFFQTRPKLIHSVGAVVTGKFVIKNTSLNYTGIFRSGCDNIILRFSLAGEPDPNVLSITPAVAIKFLRNGIPSGNLIGMYSLLGQDSWNFFKHDLTNHVPDLYSGAGEAYQFLRSLFATASNIPVFIGVSDLARFDQSGTEFKNPSFPFRVIFHPVTPIHTKFPDTYPGMNLQEQLSTLLPPGILFEVYVQHTPTSTTFSSIGYIQTDSFPTPSLFGDKGLFFQHSRMEDDLKYRPDWTQACYDIMKQQQQSATQYTYPDLPWN